MEGGWLGYSLLQRFVCRDQVQLIILLNDLGNVISTLFLFLFCEDVPTVLFELFHLHFPIVLIKDVFFLLLLLLDQVPLVILDYRLLFIVAGSPGIGMDDLVFSNEELWVVKV